MRKNTIDKYLHRYAESEAGLAQGLPRVYEAALVVPAYREQATLIQQLLPAASAAAGPILLILVVNAPDDADAMVHRENGALLEAVRRMARRAQRWSSAVEWLEIEDRLDVVLVDRATSGCRLPAGEGVGLARKIGCDLALEAMRSGKLRRHWLYSTDADVRLPADYFKTPSGLVGDERALLFPFEHSIPSSDESLGGATLLYEISLRYFVLGLARAGSPYAFHSIGSTLAVDAEAYAQVRGFPRRQAGEDFYLLDKLAKLGPLRKLVAPRIEISARRSNRAPFGTGRGVEKLETKLQQAEVPRLYHPQLFALLGATLQRLSDWCGHRDFGRLAGELDALDGHIYPALEALRVFRALGLAAGQARGEVALLRRFHTWFDGLRTLRFVHLLRDAAFPSLPWPEALRGSDLYQGPAEPESARRALAQLELKLPPRVGPSLVLSTSSDP